MKSAVSASVLFIFQLAASSGVRSRRQASGSASTPGSSSPSMKVEGGAAAGREPVHVVAEPELDHRRGRVAAADHGVALGVGDGLGDRPGPGRERRQLERAHRAVPEDRAAAGDPLRVLGGGVGADVEAHPALGDVDPVQVLDLGAGVELAAQHQVLGQVERRLGLPGLRQHLLRRLDALVVDQRVADVAALGLEEAEAHRAADQDLVGLVEEALDHADLVGHLRPAEHHDQRPLGAVADLGQLLQLALQQQARRGRAGAARRRGWWRGRGGRRRRRRSRRGRRARRGPSPARGRSRSRPARSGCSRAPSRRRPRAPRPSPRPRARPRREPARPRLRAARRGARRRASSTARGPRPRAGPGARPGRPARPARAAARSSAATPRSGCRRRSSPSSSGTFRSARSSTRLPVDVRVPDAPLHGG